MGRNKPRSVARGLVSSVARGLVSSVARGSVRAVANMRRNKPHLSASVPRFPPLFSLLPLPFLLAIRILILIIQRNLYQISIFVYHLAYVRIRQDTSGYVRIHW